MGIRMQLREQRDEAAARPFAQLDLQAEVRHSGRRRVGLRHTSDGLPQALAVHLSVPETAKFAVPQEPKWTDFFTAIQTPQGAPRLISSIIGQLASEFSPISIG